MTRYLLDTNAMGDFINHRGNVPTRAREARRRGDIIGTCEPVAAELFHGAENSATRDENLRRVHRALRRVPCWPLDRRASEEYSRLTVALRWPGDRSGRWMC